MNRVPSWLTEVSVDEFEDILEELPPPQITRIHKDDEVNKEYSGLLSFAAVFDDCSEYIGTLPSQCFYGGYYVGQMMAHDNHQKTWPRKIELRAKRNYMSFIREYHLFVLLNRAFPRFEVVFDSDYDRRGIDFVLRHKNKEIGLCSFLGTKNSYGSLHRKRMKHNDMITIDLPLYPQEAREINGYWLYSWKEHISPLKKKINKLMD